MNSISRRLISDSSFSYFAQLLGAVKIIQPRNFLIALLHYMPAKYLSFSFARIINTTLKFSQMHYRNIRDVFQHHALSINCIGRRGKKFSKYKYQLFKNSKETIENVNRFFVAEICLSRKSANYFQLRFHLRGNDIFCFSDVTQPVRNIFMQNDSCPCPSLHGHHSTSLTMPQGKIAVKTPRTRCYPTCNYFF